MCAWRAREAMTWGVRGRARVGAGHVSQVLPLGLSCVCMCWRACSGMNGEHQAGTMWQSAWKERRGRRGGSRGGGCAGRDRLVLRALCGWRAREAMTWSVRGRARSGAGHMSQFCKSEDNKAAVTL
jgi:hypothetical protein